MDVIRDYYNIIYNNKVANKYVIPVIKQSHFIYQKIISNSILTTKELWRYIIEIKINVNRLNLNFNPVMLHSLCYNVKL